jgi:hypothetical protein
MKLYVKDIETINDLQAWVDERLAPSKVVIDGNGEVVIRTGLTVEMNGVLYPLEWDTDNE